MTETYLIGIDLGSSFTKAAIYDTQGNSLGEAKRDAHPNQPRPGVAEYDGPQLLQASLSAIKELLEKSQVAAKDVAAICFDGMISGTMGIDAAGDATTPYTTTLDMRFAPHLNYVMDNFHDLIREKTGAGQPTFAPKMLWIQAETPDVYKRSAKFVTICGYLIGKMAGLTAEEAFIDYTYLWATGLSDSQRYTWSDELCQAMKLPLDKLPRIVKSSDIVGRVTPAAAAATGLLAGTPIVAGAGDQSTGFIGAGITKPGRMADNAGTYPVIALCTDEFRPDMKNKMAEIIPSVIPGLWNPVSIIFGGGLSHHWFQENFAYADVLAAEKWGSGRTVYHILDENAAKLPPGSDKLFFIPHLGGRACPTNTNYKGAWFGFTWSHKREHFYRAVLEAIAYDQCLSFQSMQNSYPDLPVTEVTAYGGGSQSALWNQIKADVMGVPYACLAREDLSALGNAILAGYALGIYDDMAATAERFVRRTTRFEARPQVHEFYRPYTEFYSKLLAQTEPAYAALANVPEWKE
ncbi:MAG: FGGY family carbohydrate kinase [Anaerolineae bacterium]